MNISSQKTEENQTTVMKNINFNSDIITISEENRNKNKISKKVINYYRNSIRFNYFISNNTCSGINK